MSNINGRYRAYCGGHGKCHALWCAFGYTGKELKRILSSKSKKKGKKK